MKIWSGPNTVSLSTYYCQSPYETSRKYCKFFALTLKHNILLKMETSNHIAQRSLREAYHKVPVFICEVHHLQFHSSPELDQQFYTWHYSIDVDDFTWWNIWTQICNKHEHKKEMKGNCTYLITNCACVLQFLFPWAPWHEISIFFLRP